MEIDPNTGLRSDGAWCASETQSRLAGEVLKLKQQLAILEDDRGAAIRKQNMEGANLIGEAIRAGHKKLAELDRQARTEQERLNKLRFPEQ